MYCSQQIAYVIKPGDTLYRIANSYHTTVPLLISQNPGIDPYNLMAGTTIMVCPGEVQTLQPNHVESSSVTPNYNGMSMEYSSPPAPYSVPLKSHTNPNLNYAAPSVAGHPGHPAASVPAGYPVAPVPVEYPAMPVEYPAASAGHFTTSANYPSTPVHYSNAPADHPNAPASQPNSLSDYANPSSCCSNPPSCPDFQKKTDLINNMREVWTQHVYWTRMLLLSIVERLKDQSEVTGRLLQNPYDIAKIYANFYDSDVPKKIAELLTEHLKIGSDLITALRDKKVKEAEDLTSRWYINADKMAESFSSITPYYDREELRKMLRSHLDLTTQEVSMRLAGKYKEDIDAFNKVEQEAISMADYFTSGLMNQFPDKFS